MIRAIQEEYEVKIDIEDDGSVYVAAADGTKIKGAIAQIEALTEEASIGKIYTGKVVRTESYGAFVEIMPGVDGMVHISQLADYRAPTVEDVVRVGDEVMVMVIDIDRGDRQDPPQPAGRAGRLDGRGSARARPQGQRRRAAAVTAAAAEAATAAVRGGSYGGGRGGGRDSGYRGSQSGSQGGSQGEAARVANLAPASIRRSAPDMRTIPPWAT